MESRLKEILFGTWLVTLFIIYQEEIRSSEVRTCATMFNFFSYTFPNYSVLPFPSSKHAYWLSNVGLRYYKPLKLFKYTCVQLRAFQERNIQRKFSCALHTWGINISFFSCSFFTSNLVQGLIQITSNLHQIVPKIKIQTP